MADTIRRNFKPKEIAARDAKGGAITEDTPFNA
jgi:hypothetical protein